MKQREQKRAAFVFGAFTVLFLVLTISSYTQQSATMDEPQHLTAGYTALRLGDYRIDLAHPAFVRMWAALPLLASPDVKLDTNNVYWLKGDEWNLAHKFLYQDNDADLLLNRARFMVAILGVLLGMGLFSWARSLFGFWPAVVALSLYTLEPNILAHASLVTTDFGITCFAFFTIYSLWCATRELTLGNLFSFALSFSLAVASKFSGILLIPIVMLLLGIRICQPSEWRIRLGRLRGIVLPAHKSLVALLILVLLGVTSYTAVWALYGFRYTPSRDSPRDVGIATSSAAFERLPQLPRAIQWLDRHHCLPNAYSVGLLSVLTKGQARSAYLMGSTSATGWWYYFPIAFLIKTPLALLCLLLLGIALSMAHWRTRWVDDSFIYLPPSVFLATAMLGNINIGLRHILPIYPFAILSAAGAIAHGMSWVRPRWWLALRRPLLGAAFLFQIVEFVMVYPHFLAFFNLSVGGPLEGHKYLSDSNIDWGQDLKGLKKWMDKNHVRSINLSYFGLADPAYYGINCSYLYPCPFFTDGRDRQPRLPGYVAVSVHNLLGASLDPPRPDLNKKLLNSKPVAVIGYSIRVYWVERPWW